MRLAALGSSFAAGPGIAPVVDRAAGRSGRNYAHLVAQGLGATLVDASVSGATTATMLTTPQRVGLRRFAPQVESVDPDVDVVTITAGGNDLGYLGSVMGTALAHRLARRHLTRPVARRLRTRVRPPATDDDVTQVTAGLVRVVEEVARRAPRARVLLVGYLTIVGPTDGMFTAAEAAGFRTTAAQLDTAFGAAAAASVAEHVSVAALSADHGVDSAQPWVRGLDLGLPLSRLTSSFHPDAAGMRAVADAVLHHLSRS